MPEATFFCIDSSDYSRNTDSIGESRLKSILDFLKTYMVSKIRENPENSTGFLTMGGKNCVVYESLTNDEDRVKSSLGKVISDGGFHFDEGIRTARLALMHRFATVGKKRIVAFICSPVESDDFSLTTVSKILRKECISIDIVNIGNPENNHTFEIFMKNLSNGNECSFFPIPEKVCIKDLLVDYFMKSGKVGNMGHPTEVNDTDMNLAIQLSLQGNENIGRELGQSSPDAECSTDMHQTDLEEIDPELALAIKLSLEYSNPENNN